MVQSKRPKRSKTEKTAISLPEDLLRHAHRMVKLGRATSLSGYFAGLARRDLAHQEFAKFLAAFEQDLGMNDEDRARIDAEMGLTQPVHGRRAS